VLRESGQTGRMVPPLDLGRLLTRADGARSTGAVGRPRADVHVRAQSHIVTSNPMNVPELRDADADVFQAASASSEPRWNEPVVGFTDVKIQHYKPKMYLRGSKHWHVVRRRGARLRTHALLIPRERPQQPIGRGSAGHPRPGGPIG
jgi:hypothetical protein